MCSKTEIIGLKDLWDMKVTSAGRKQVKKRWLNMSNTLNTK